VVVDGRLRDSIRAARDRGALLDIGHGMSGFDPGIARAMLDLGELPDTISTDLHAYSRSLVVDFPTVLSKFLALGMSLAEVLFRATLAPARAVSLAEVGIGTLRAGAPADIAVLRRVPGNTMLGGIPATERLECVLTVSGGTIVHDTRSAA
jgi:dihydroorotase